MKTKTILISVILVITMVIACKKEKMDPSVQLDSTPNLPATPYDYLSSSNDKKAALGRVLFYDKQLSLNNSIACGSCHQQSRAFCDNQPTSLGLENVKGTRNTPSIFAKSGGFFWDGRAFSLTDLALKPIKNHVEMGFENLAGLAQKLSTINYYPDLFLQAFGSSAIDSTKIRDAIAEFLFNFKFSDNKFTRSENNTEQLSATEELGRQVFFGKGRCLNCHHISGSNGYGSVSGFNIGLDEVYKDKGMGALFNNASSDGVFMTPVLLNVAFTSPYMHDGRFKTLEEVVEHYNSGIKDNKNLDPNLRDFDVINGLTEAQILAKYDTNHDGDIDWEEQSVFPPVKMNLSASEKRGLVEFLRTLSDEKILSDVKFSNPFAKK